jgi:hypothetical protein
MSLQMWKKPYENRRTFIGGSDARIIMGTDEAALIQLWREKRGEADPEDVSGNLIVQLGAATEALNRSWYERKTIAVGFVLIGLARALQLLLLIFAYGSVELLRHLGAALPEH